MSVLRDWYDGNIYPMDDILPEDSDYREVTNELGEIMQHLEGILPAEEQENFEKMKQLQHESDVMETYANFAYGFRLGALLMSEILGFKMVRNE